MIRQSKNRRFVIPVLFLIVFLGIGGVFLHSLFAERYAQSADTAIATGKTQLFERSVSGALQAYQTFQTAAAGADYAGANSAQKIKLRVYLAFTRMLDLFARDDGGSMDTLAELLARYGVSKTGDAFDAIRFHLPLNDDGKIIPPSTAPPSADAMKAFFAGPFLTAVNASLADMDAAIALCPTSGAGDDVEIIAGDLIAPDDPGQPDVEMDAGDYYLFRALLKFLKGYALMCAGYNADLDIREVIALINMEAGPSMFKRVLDRYPDFLKVSDAAKMNEARRTLLEAIADYETASSRIRGDASTAEGAEELFSLDPDDYEEALLRENLAKIKTSLQTGTSADLVTERIGTEYSVYGGSSFDTTGDNWWDKGVHPEEHGYTYLGKATGTATFAGAYNYYIISTRPGNMAPVDAVQGSDNAYYGTGITGGTSQWWNVGGAPDMIYALVGGDSAGSNAGFIVIHPVSSISSVKVYLTNEANIAREEHVQLNPFPLFGDGTAGSAKALRDMLPQMSDCGYFVPGTMGHGLSDDPTLGGLLPGFTQDQWIIDSESLFLPSGPITIPQVTSGGITIDGDVVDWNVISPVMTDMTGEKGSWMAAHGDLKQLYLARDSNYLYVRMEMAGDIAQTGQAFMYGLRFRQSPGDASDKSGDMKAFARQRDGVWEVQVQTVQPGGYYGPLTNLEAYGGAADSAGKTVEFCVPLGYLTLAGRYLAVDVDSWSYYQEWDYGWWSYDKNDTCLQIQPTASLTGTLTVPGYDGVGVVRVGVFEYQNGFNSSPEKRIGGTTIYPDGAGNLPASYMVAGLPVGTNAFVSVFWDRDGNGVVGPGDYTNFYPPLTTVGGDNTLNLVANDGRPDYSAPVFTNVRVFSKVKANGSRVVQFLALLTGPSPEDVSITATGPGGEFTLSPAVFSKQSGLIYSCEVYWLPDGEYTFTAVDSLGRRTETTYLFQNIWNIPKPVMPTAWQNAYAGTATPTLSWTPPAGGQYAYQVLVYDMRMSTLWYSTAITSATTVTIPAGVLLPDASYAWYIRTFDSADHPMNCRESDWGYFYTGASAATPTAALAVIGARPPSGGGTTYTFWIDVSVPGLAPWEINQVRWKDPYGNLLPPTSITPITHFDRTYYEIYFSSATKPVDGNYTLEMDYTRSGGATQTLVMNNLTFVWEDVETVDATTMTPGINHYFQTTTPTFSWNPVDHTDTTYYHLRIFDPLSRTRVWRSDWSKDVAVTVPAGVLLPGQPYLWTVMTAQTVNPTNVTRYANESAVSGRFMHRFTINAVNRSTSPPVFVDNGYGIVTYKTEAGVQYDMEVIIVDLDGIASDGSSHTVTIRTPSGSQQTLTYAYSENSTKAIYRGYIALGSSQPESGDFTFTATDPEGHAGTMVDTLAAHTLPLPEAASFSLTVGSVLADTTPTVAWAAVPGAQEYRLRIYSADGATTIWTGTVGAPSCTVPPGVLAPNTAYRYRVYARDARWPFDIDNVSVSPASPATAVPFTTGVRSDGPFISLESGVSTATSIGGVHPTRLYFSIWVHDAQGVPGNIRSVKAIFPSGHQEPLYYDAGNGDNTAIRGVYTRVQDVAPESGRYTFMVEDLDGHTVTVSEELTVNPLGYPSLASLSAVMNNAGGGTAVNFDWADVSGAAYYRLRIYDAAFNLVLYRHTTQSGYALPDGLLDADSLYRYDVTAYRELPGEGMDNYSTSKWGGSDMPSFLTGALKGGSSPPAIDLQNYGVWIDHMRDPRSDAEFNRLNFVVKATDWDGVPGNISSVKATYPDGVTTRDLHLDTVISGIEAIYYARDLAPGAIQSGKYTFTVTDFDGNSATAEDTLEINPLPCPVNLKPQAGSVVIGATPTITWDPVQGAAGGYVVRIYDGWDGEIYKSDRLTSTEFIVPADLLRLNATYSFTVFAHREAPDVDLDNRSQSDDWSFAGMNHFTTSSTHLRGDVDGDGHVALADLVAVLQTVVGMNPEAYSDADVNRDGRIGLPEAIYILESLSGLR